MTLSDQGGCNGRITPSRHVTTQKQKLLGRNDPVNNHNICYDLPFSSGDTSRGKTNTDETRMDTTPHTAKRGTQYRDGTKVVSEGREETIDLPSGLSPSLLTASWTVRTPLLYHATAVFGPTPCTLDNSKHAKFMGFCCGKDAYAWVGGGGRRKLETVDTLAK